MSQRCTGSSFFGLLVLLALAGCAAQPSAEHGRSIVRAIAEPGPASSHVVHELLQPILEESRRDGARLAPGLRASYAFHACSAGDRADAARALTEEATDYPGARRFLDALAAHLGVSESGSEAPRGGGAEK